MEKLEVLHLNGNRFEIIHTDLANLRNLKILSLDWFEYLPVRIKCPITRGKDDVFEHFFKLL